MAGFSSELHAHLATGLTTLCRCWEMTRRDGVVFGFTDHDLDLHFEGVTFRAESGLSAVALQQSAGLSVDNTEALGALSAVAVRDEDIEAGLIDGAALKIWRVNWMDVTQRALQFRGTIGEIRRGNGVFHAELRGLTEALNRPLGRVYQKPCTAVLGDRDCGFALDTAGYSTSVELQHIEDNVAFVWEALPGFAPDWFSDGKLTVSSGAAEGLWGAIKIDVVKDGARRIELWEPIRKPLAPGDVVRLDAGCDKRFETCKLKFGNLLNFQGFPDIPGEDWMMAVPKKAGRNSGGSLR